MYLMHEALFDVLRWMLMERMHGTVVPLLVETALGSIREPCLICFVGSYLPTPGGVMGDGCSRDSSIPFGV